MIETAIATYQRTDEQGTDTIVVQRTDNQITESYAWESFAGEATEYEAVVWSDRDGSPDMWLHDRDVELRADGYVRL